MPAPKGNQFAAGNKGGGRPSAYKKEFAKIAESMCKLGAIDADLADAFDVGITTINAWKARYEEFSEALKLKEGSDDRVERSLYQKAVGYTFDSEKVFQFQGEIVRTKTREHVPPDTTAAIFWLKNRRRAEWRDKVDHEHTGKDGESLAALSDAEVARRVAFLLASGAQPQDETSSENTDDHRPSTH